MTPIDSGAVIELLQTTPRHLASAVGGLGEKELRWKPTAESWSVNEILAHLRACADVWGEAIGRILQQDHPTIRHVSPRTWIRKTNYLSLDFQVSFREYGRQRDELLQVLQSLRPEEWQRRATVKAATKLREETVLSYAGRLANHEAGHCAQIDRVVQAARLAGQPTSRNNAG